MECSKETMVDQLIKTYEGKLEKSREENDGLKKEIRRLAVVNEEQSDKMRQLMLEINHLKTQMKTLEAKKNKYKNYLLKHIDTLPKQERHDNNLGECLSPGLPAKHTFVLQSPHARKKDLNRSHTIANPEGDIIENDSHKNLSSFGRKKLNEQDKLAFDFKDTDGSGNEVDSPSCALKENSPQEDSLSKFTTERTSKSSLQDRDVSEAFSPMVFPENNGQQPEMNTLVTTLPSRVYQFSIQEESSNETEKVEGRESILETGTIVKLKSINSRMSIMPTLRGTLKPSARPELPAEIKEERGSECQPPVKANLFEEFFVITAHKDAIRELEYSDKSLAENTHTRMAPHVLFRYPNIDQECSRRKSVPTYAFPFGVRVEKPKISKNHTELKELIFGKNSKGNNYFVFMLNTEATTDPKIAKKMDPFIAKVNPNFYLYCICVVSEDYYDVVIKEISL